MQDLAASTLVIFLSALVGLLALLLAIASGISRTLRRIEHRLAEAEVRRETSESFPPPAETGSGGAFEEFLNEDKSRRSLTKSEQFAAYRRWRQEKGLNWTNP